MKLANIGLIPVVVSLKSLRTLQCGVPFDRKSLLPSSSIITSITRYARTKARATLDEDVSFQTFSTVFHILSIVASVLLYIWSWAECLCDIEGNNDRSKTLVYGPVRVVVEVNGYVIK
jgi:hypothetical protein